MKSASSWINNCLWEHPEITPALTKELHFFDDDSNYKKGVEYYLTFFNPAEGTITGEITPSYLYDTKVPSRIYSNFPNVKLVVCLRNPADRAWSEYRYAVETSGRLSIYGSFLDAISNDSSLIDHGRYAQQIKGFLESVSYTHLTLPTKA